MFWAFIISSSRGFIVVYFCMQSKHYFLFFYKFSLLEQSDTMAFDISIHIILFTLRSYHPSYEYLSSWKFISWIHLSLVEKLHLTQIFGWHYCIFSYIHPTHGIWKLSLKCVRTINTNFYFYKMIFVISSVVFNNPWDTSFIVKKIWFFSW